REVDRERVGIVEVDVGMLGRRIDVLQGNRTIEADGARVAAEPFRPQARLRPRGRAERERRAQAAEGAPPNHLGRLATTVRSTVTSLATWPVPAHSFWPTPKSRRFNVMRPRAVPLSRPDCAASSAMASVKGSTASRVTLRSVSLP